ncbi:MAG: hypothetical protein Q7J21_02275 [Rugosibacter sp.]|nr:hypothetical protein [Rugosibacter sp.]
MTRTSRLSRILFTALTFSAALPVLAQTSTPGMDHRQQRIEQGTQSGALKNREANPLEKAQEHIQGMEDKAKGDGSVTAQERKRLQQAETVQSRHLSREKHDRQHESNHQGIKDHSQTRSHRR